MSFVSQNSAIQSVESGVLSNSQININSCMLGVNKRTDVN